MVIQPFEAADERAFLGMCREFYEAQVTLRPYDEAIAQTTFRRVIDRHENLWGYLFTDRDSGSPVGYALITSYWCNEEGGEVIVLDELYISPLNRHKGYAKQFMEWMERQYKDCAALTLEVLTTNLSARQLYEKEGYQPDGFTTYTKRMRL